MIFEPSKHYRKHKGTVKNEFRFTKTAEILARTLANLQQQQYKNL